MSSQCSQNDEEDPIAELSGAGDGLAPPDIDTIVYDRWPGLADWGGTIPGRARMGTSDSENWQPDGWDQPPPQREGGWQQPGGFESQPGGWGSDAPRGPMPASIGKRIGAYIIDSILIGIVNALLGFAIGAGAMGGLEAGAEIDPTVRITTALVGLFLSAAYFTLLEARNGQTLAKMMLSIRSVRMDDAPMDIPTAFRRTFWFYVAGILGLIPGGLLTSTLASVVGFGLALVLLITTVTDQPNRRGLHDKFADTMVIEA